MILLTVAALAGAVATLVALVILHVSPTGLSPLRDPVSAYGITRFRSMYRLQTLGTAVSAAALAVALPLRFGAPATAAAISLAALAVARAAISWFPMDAEDASRTTTGRLHNVLAFGAFAAASVSGFMVSIALTSDAATFALAPVAGGLGWLMTAASVLTLLAGAVRGLRPIFGLAERLIYLGMLGLLVVTSVVLILA